MIEPIDSSIVPKIIIYTTPTCAPCKMTKAFLKENNVSYEEKDVTVDDKAREEMIQKSGSMTVPVIDIDGQIVVGFKRAELIKLINLKRQGVGS